MFFRQLPAEWQATGNAERKAAMQAIVESGQVPGLLAYRGGRPVSRCSVAPRQQYVRIEHSKTLGPVDERPAWPIVCLFIARRARGTGVAAALLDGGPRGGRHSGQRREPSCDRRHDGGDLDGDAGPDDRLDQRRALAGQMLGDAALRGGSQVQPT
jgi:hypothetical protein